MRALVLMSGGLDSSIAAKLLLEQDIEVIGLYFYTGFCITAQKAKTGRKEKSYTSDVVDVAKELGIRLEMLDVSKEYVPMVSKPKYGYGKNMNPCIDCRVFMLTETRKLLDFFDADFVATGEVVGQRPKSQKMHTQKLVAEEAELEGLLVRPLSGQIMPPTIPEQKGWLKRDKLENIYGRSRKRQIELAKKWNITAAATPAGGCCFLADETYSTRFKELVNERQELLDLNKAPPLSQQDVILLGLGRHFKVRRGLRLLCGRNEGENKLLSFHARGRVLVRSHADLPGPSAILDEISGVNIEPLLADLDGWQTEFNSELAVLTAFIQKNGLNLDARDLAISAAIVARYTDHEGLSMVPIVFEYTSEKGEQLDICQVEIKPFEQQSILQARAIIKK